MSVSMSAPVLTASEAVDTLRDALTRAADGDQSAAAEAAALFEALDAYLRETNPLPSQWRSSAGWHSNTEPETITESVQMSFFDDQQAPVVPAPIVVAPEVPVQPAVAMLPSPGTQSIPTAPVASATTPTAGTPLSDVQDWLRQRLDDGVRCPACDQFAKVYRRNIYATLAKHLISMWTMGGPHRRFLSLSQDLNQGGGDMGKMRYWGLVDEESTVLGENGRQGYWRLTTLGVDFVLGRVTLPKYAYIYDGVCLRLDGPQVSIGDALGKKFNYAALMEPAA